eukprot:5104242-Prymnesium_polylepis.1
MTVVVDRLKYETSQPGLETTRLTHHTSHITHHTRNFGPKYGNFGPKYAGNGQRPCADALNRGPGWRSPPWHAVSC